MCNQNKRGNIRYGQAPLGEYHAGAPLDRIHIDILGPITTSQDGNVYILMLVDQFTKWLECWPLPNQTAELIAKKVVKDFISHFWVSSRNPFRPRKDFDSSLVKAICDLLEITKTRTTPYRPSSNGQVERYNSMLLHIIQCYLHAKQKTWDQDLEELAATIRAMKNRQTQFSANMLMLGRELRRPIDLMLGVEHAYMHQNDPAQWVQNLHEALKQVPEVAHSNI